MENFYFLVQNRKDSSDQRSRSEHQRWDFIPRTLVIVPVCYPAVVDLKLVGSVGSKVTDGAGHKQTEGRVEEEREPAGFTADDDDGG